jgi:hypothetical protein
MPAKLPLQEPFDEVYYQLTNYFMRVVVMSHELDIDGRELLAMSEEAPDQVEAIIEMMIEADEDLFADEEEE